MVNDWTHSLSADISSAEDHFTAVPDQWITDCRPDKTTDEWSCHTMYMPTATLRMTEILAISHPLRGRLPRSGWQTTKRAACRHPSYLLAMRRRSSVHVVHRAAGAALLREHGHFVHVQHAVIGHCARHLHVMAFMSFDRIGIRDSNDFLVLVGDEHGLFTGFDALFRAGRVFGVGALGAALGIADLAVPGHVFRRRQHSHADQTEPDYQEHSFCHCRTSC